MNSHKLGKQPTLAIQLIKLIIYYIHRFLLWLPHSVNCIHIYLVFLWRLSLSFFTMPWLIHAFRMIQTNAWISAFFCLGALGR
jgi:hypothetical protein